MDKFDKSMLYLLLMLCLLALLLDECPAFDKILEVLQ